MCEKLSIQCKGFRTARLSRQNRVVIQQNSRRRGGGSSNVCVSTLDDTRSGCTLLPRSTKTRQLVRPFVERLL